MTDNEIIKASVETNTNKIKAIYPHITVSGDVDKPYYNIDWYDIEKQTMYRGYSSYNLQFVRKWLEEEFEVVEEDIDNLINRQQAKIERLSSCVKSEDEIYAIMKAQMEPMVKAITNEQIDLANKCGRISGILEFAEKLKLKSGSCVATDNGIMVAGSRTYTISEIKLDNLVKEMVGEDETT